MILIKLMTQQTKFILRQKEALITMMVLLGLVIVTYLGNVMRFRGMDVSVMYHPMKILTLSYNRTNYNADVSLFFIMLYPLLAALPAGFSYVKEQQTKEEVYLMIRCGKRNYLLSKLGAAFFATAIVFSVPFLLEILMNCLSFPLKAQRDLSHLRIYSIEYAKIVRNYLGSSVYMVSPYLYAVMGTLWFGVFSGVLGMFTVALSYAAPFKFRAVLLFPVYFLLNFTTTIDTFVGTEGPTLCWYEYVLLFSEGEKSIPYMLGGMAVLLMATGLFYRIGRKMEKW